METKKEKTQKINFSVPAPTPDEHEETIRFSLNGSHTKHAPSAKTKNAESKAKKVPDKKIPTEFEDIFSQEKIRKEENAISDKVIGIEEFFKNSTPQIGGEHQDEIDPQAHKEHEKNKREKRAALIIGIISAVIIAAAVTVLVLLFK